MGDYFNGCMFGAGYGGAGFIFMIVWWIIIIALLILLVRWLMGLGRPHERLPLSRMMWGNEKTPLQILAERYAKGEINKEEFEQKKKDLSHGHDKDKEDL